MRTNKRSFISLLTSSLSSIEYLTIHPPYLSIQALHTTLYLHKFHSNKAHTYLSIFWYRIEMIAKPKKYNMEKKEKRKFYRMIKIEYVSKKKKKIKWIRFLFYCCCCCCCCYWLHTDDDSLTQNIIFRVL